MSINYIIVIILGLWLFAGRRARARGLLKHVRAFSYESFCANGVLDLATRFSLYVLFCFCLYFRVSLTTRTVNFLPRASEAHFPLMTKRTRAKLRLISSPSHRIGFLAHKHK